MFLPIYCARKQGPRCAKPAKADKADKRKPGKPDKPANPDKPDKPDKPDTARTPDKPDKLEKPSSDFETRGAEAPPLSEFKVRKSSVSHIRGAPSIQGYEI